jgi:hypothetical protein
MTDFDNGGMPNADSLTAINTELVKQFTVVILDDHSLLLTDDKAGNFRAIFALCADKVEKLELIGEGWRDRHLEQLQQLRLSKLSSLSLQVCARVTDEGLMHLSKIGTLQILDLSTTTAEKITLIGLRMLQRLPLLDLLRLPSTWPGGRFSYQERETVRSNLRALFPDTIIKY